MTGHLLPTVIRRRKSWRLVITKPPSPQAYQHSIATQRTQDVSQGLCIDVPELWPTKHSEVTVGRTDVLFIYPEIQEKG